MEDKKTDDEKPKEEFTTIEGPVSEVPIKNDTIDLEKLTSELPAVVPDAVAAAEQKDAAQKVEASGAVDRWGNAFDPSLHAALPDGSPDKTPTGRFKRKKLNEPGQMGPGKIQVAPDTGGNGSLQAEIRGAAIICADMFINFGVSIFGDEWRPIKEKDYDERSYLIMVNEQYMQENGLVKIPGWAVLAMAYGTYSVKRFNQPRTRTFIQKITQGFTAMVGRIVAKVQRKKVEAKDEKNDKPAA